MVSRHRFDRRRLTGKPPSAAPRQPLAALLPAAARAACTACYALQRAPLTMLAAPRSRSVTTTPVRSRSVTTTVVRSRTVTNDLSVEELRNLVDNMLASSLMNEGDAEGNTPVHFLADVRRKEVFDDLFGREEIQKLFKDVGRGQYSDGVVFIREPHVLQVPVYPQDDFKDTRASHLAVAALIVTVAFAAFFTITGG
ncbi:hypothetical protein WN944_026323 [Citrus x changshan-huyou]|uniref:Uncharacterized protein n=1 Tax=Citrus x changshan-huyou TaxID=2935761 RepID=A0AAP0LRF7_9ROSI